MGLFTKNYSKPGKGVEKNEQQKRPFFLFFELFFAKFWKMIQLNLLYLLFWIPAIAASAFMTNISPTLAYLLFFLIEAFPYLALLAVILIIQLLVTLSTGKYMKRMGGGKNA